MRRDQLTSLILRVGPFGFEDLPELWPRMGVLGATGMLQIWVVFSGDQTFFDTFHIKTKRTMTGRFELLEAQKIALRFRENSLA